MINDITMLDSDPFGEVGSQTWLVKSNTSAQGTGSSYTPAFRPGEPVYKTLGTGTTNNSAQLWGALLTGTSAKPVVATDFMAGIAMSTSTETDTANGVVYVQPLQPNCVYLMNADNTTTYGNGSTPVQATYNALVGSRVLMKMDTSLIPKFTVLASDGSTSGLVVMPLDVTKYPGKVAISFRNGLNFLT